MQKNLWQTLIWLCPVVCIAVFAFGRRAESANVPVQAPAQTDPIFEKTVQPFFANNCYSCHNDERQAGDLGFTSPHIHLPADASQADLLAAVGEFNDDKTVHGLLVQYPVPAHLDYDAALSAIDPDKDVDGMHPVNMGRLALMMPGPVPATPADVTAWRAAESPTTWRSGQWDTRSNGGITTGGVPWARPLATTAAASAPGATWAVP